MANAYIFYGKAGSGKGTQASLLKDYLISKNHGVVMIENGALFREFAKGPGFLAKKTHETMSRGELMPAFMPVYTWTKALVDSFNGTEEVIFDGVTRRLDEAPLLDSALQYLGFEKIFIFHVHIFDETALERMQSRAILAGADARKDDVNKDALQTRLDAYKNQVMPVLEYFASHPRFQVVEINGEETIEGVWGQIEEVVG